MGLKETREAMGLGKEDMAALMGIKEVSNYLRLENGRRGLTHQQKLHVKMVFFVYQAGQLGALQLYVAQHDKKG